jgi:hypothetical protein
MRLTSRPRLDGEQNEDVRHFSAVHNMSVGSQELDLGQGVKITQNNKKLSAYPEEYHLRQYMAARASDLAQMLHSQEPERRLDGPWGAHRVWQVKFRIVTYQLLHTALNFAHMGRCPGGKMSWLECWSLYGAIVGRYFFQKGPTLTDPMKPFLKVVRDSTYENLATLYSGRKELEGVTDKFMLLMAGDARTLATMVEAATAPKRPAAPKAQPLAPPSPTRTASICGDAACSYHYNTWACTHLITVKCTNKVKGTTCGVAHARSGPRGWTCTGALAAQKVLTTADRNNAFLMKEQDWVATNHAQLAAFNAAK